MVPTLPRKTLVWAAAFGGAVFFSAVFAKQAVAPVQLEPSAEERKAARTSVLFLKHLHYEHKKLNDALSSQIFDRYLKDLDGQHSYLLASDVAQFEPYRYQLDDDLTKGDLGHAFDIFERFNRRAVERLDFVLAELGKGVDKLDFKHGQSLETKRDNVPWARSAAELDDLWRKRLMAAVLSLRMAGKTDEEITKTLTKRYEVQRNNLFRGKPDDAFQVFMNSFSETYDPHTEYFTPRTSEDFNINMSLSLQGIGAELKSEDEYTKIVNVLPGSPAEKSRQLSPGDRITAVAQGDGEFEDVVGWRIDEVVAKIRGPEGSTVRLQVIPASSPDIHQTKVVTLVRNTIKLENRAAKKRVITITRNGIEHKIGVIKLPAFYADFQGMQSGKSDYRSTTRDVRKLIGELEAEHIEGLVLDLRNNGGGSLTEANELVGLFIETGPTVQIRNANGDVEVMGDSDPSVAYDGPLVVMTNRLSASAAEIFAGAIQDYGRGLIVGSTTFGKGTVQSLRDLNYGRLKITEGKFYRISGASTQHRGVVPDIAFPNIYDNDDIGESSLPNALPWDTIAPARFLPFAGYGKDLVRLRTLSQQRQDADPDFRYLNAQIALAQSMRKETAISLNEGKRKEEQKTMDDKRLAIENARRSAKGQPPLKSWREAENTDAAADDADDTPDNNDKDKPEEEAFVLESGRILLDSVAQPAPDLKVAKEASLH